MWQSIKAAGRWCADAIAAAFRWVRAAASHLRWYGLGTGVLPLVCWAALLVLGTWFPATTLLKHFFNGGPLPEGFAPVTGSAAFAGLLLVAVASWTWTNLVGLCLAAAYLGIAARPKTSEDDRTPWEQVLPRAYVVYLACLFQEIVLSGGLIPSDARLTSGDFQQHYVCLAVISSLVCFATAFRPALFDQLLNGVFGRVPALQQQGTVVERHTEFAMEAKERLNVVQPNGDTTVPAALSGPKG
jgi:hypothetical protein